MGGATHPTQSNAIRKVILCIATKICIEINGIRQLNTKIDTTQVYEKTIKQNSDFLCMLHCKVRTEDLHPEVSSTVRC